MKSKYLVFLLCIWFAGTEIALAQQRKDVQVHVVKQGETLYKIARTYGLSVAELKRLNGLTRDNIRVGQRLIVKPPTLDVPASPEIYTVKEGETLYAIAFRFGLSVDTLLALNPLEEPFLEPGQTLRLLPVPTVRGYTTYRVRRGDTLFKIATRFGISLQALRQANGLRGTTIRVGQRLRIPVQKRLRPRERLQDAPPDTTGPVAMYPPTFAGRLTASGEVYNPEDFTGSHPELPFGTVVVLTSSRTGRSVFVRVNDRGPWEPGILMELSQAAAEALGIRVGTREVVEMRIIGRAPSF